jgi:tetratricopeptide (TPR) repeat protein
MAKEKPDDLGARMALAVAYAQAGYMEHALHEYGRLLKNRHVPAPMLQLVSDLLSDVEDEASGSIRFHQTRGDLYMKQGRYQEAIEEYNKIK